MRVKFLDKIHGNVKSVLDIGCNKGYMSKRFAKSGAKILGIDIKSQHINFKNYSFKKVDVRNFSFEKYDLIINSLMLHFIDKKISQGIIEKMKEATNKGGYNLLILMSNKDSMNLPGKFYPSLKEIKRVYSGWVEINSIQGETEKEVNSKGQEHHHNLIFCLFKK